MGHGEGLQRGVTLLLPRKESGEFYKVEFYRVSEGHAKDRLGQLHLCEKRKAVLILLVIEPQRNRLTCFLIMIYFYPFAVEANGVYVEWLLHCEIIEDDSWNVPGWHPKLSSCQPSEAFWEVMKRAAVTGNYSGSGLKEWRCTSHCCGVARELSSVA